MKQPKTFKDQLLDKHPNMNNITSCFNCGHDLTCDNKIHRIDMEWYCDKCYNRYKRKQSVLEELWDNPQDDLWNDA